jgi:hypothetical protein
MPLTVGLARKAKKAVENKTYKKLHTVEMKTYLADYLKVNGAKIKNTDREYREKNTAKIKVHYENNAPKVKVRVL